MTTTAWKEGQVFLKSFDKDGGVSVTSHQCWNVDRFKASAQSNAVAAGGHVEYLTQEEYKNAGSRR